MLKNRNKYHRWYDSLISRAKDRQLAGYFERHHITPKSLGGLDECDNLVDLTAREHFIAHLLLTKMFDGLDKRKMSYAFSFMLTKNPKLKSRHRGAARWYAYSRKLLSQTQKGRIFSESTKLKMQKSAITRFKSIEERAKVAGWTKNPNARTREKIGRAARNRTPESIEKMRAAKRKPCTIDGIIIFESKQHLANAFGWGKTGTGSPDFRFL